MAQLNTTAIDKIIARYSMADYNAAADRWYATHAKYKRNGEPNTMPCYSLSARTLDAIDVKNEFMSGEITKEEYKAYCLKINIRGDIL